jgi:glycosyltransferase involved in cell wall biosynthesis
VATALARDEQAELPASESARLAAPLSVTVGIPAFNEGANIGRLLAQILRQQEDGFKLEQLVVVSDGSTDDTCAAVERMRAVDGRITLVAGAERRGRSARQLEFMRLCRSDALVSFDGDVLLRDPDVLARLVAPIAAGADLVSGGLVAAPTRSLLENALASGLRLRNRVSAAYRGGDNVYTCHGPVRAFSRRAYQTYACRDGSAEDAYSYLWAKQHGFTYHFAPDVNVEIKLPGTLRDHWLQSARFQQNQSELRRYFPASMVRSAFRLPPLLCLQALLDELRSAPGYTLAYIIILGLTTVTTQKKSSGSSTWTIATSTKKSR